MVDDCQKHPISGIHIPKAHGGETICSAAKIGGILVNDAHHANFLYDNLMIQANVVDAAYRCGVGKAMLLGSSYLHPKFPLQPIIEEARLPAPGHRSTKGTPSLDRGHQVWSGLSATALLRRDQRTMPTNLYGPGDKVRPEQFSRATRLHSKGASGANGRGWVLTIFGSRAPRAGGSELG